MDQPTLCIVVSLWSATFGAIPPSGPGVGYRQGAPETAAAQPQQLHEAPAGLQASRSSSERVNPAASQECIRDQIGDCGFLRKLKLRCRNDGSDAVIAAVTYRNFPPLPGLLKQTKVRRDRDGLVLCRKLRLKRNGRLKGRVRFPNEFPGQQIRYCVEDKDGNKCERGCGTKAC